MKSRSFLEMTGVMTDNRPRLSEMAHGGGCGCKLAPAVLRDILAKMPIPAPSPDLLVGTETSDDAAVYRLNDAQAIVATTDFFTPVVDDPYVFGRIAATNALSDVYAMGGTPLFALALVGMPVNTMPVETIQDILAGGASICGEAGIPVVGGHSIDTPEPIYGLVAIGLVHPDKARRNASGQAGDTLILTKGLGIGVFSAALKKNALPDAAYEAMIASTTTLNRVGAELSEIPAVHAVTDVTGFGLLGHLLEMCRGSGLSATITAADAPLLDGAQALADAGFVTGASTRNWASYGEAVRLPDRASASTKALLTDPQTSGGLLIACDPAEADMILALCRTRGHAQAAVIGRLEAGEPGVTVV